MRWASGLSFGASRTPGIAGLQHGLLGRHVDVLAAPAALARSVSASSAPTAASAPACSQAWGTDVRTGARSLSPLSAWAHPAARIVRSDAAQSGLRAVGPERA